MDPKQDNSTLRVGQRLWYKNKNTDKVGFVLVERLYRDFFVYQMNGESHKGKYEWIGKRLYHSLFDIPLTQQVVTTVRKKSPISPKKAVRMQQGIYRSQPSRKRTPPPTVPQVIPAPTPPPPPRTPSCDICALRKNGTCGSLSNQLCEDYKPTQYISKEELDSFPEFGDATAFRLKKWNR